MNSDLPSPHHSTTLINKMVSFLTSNNLYKHINIFDSVLSNITDNTEFIILFNTLFIFLITSMIILYSYKLVQRVKGSAGYAAGTRILITGPTKSGKTLLFNLLQSNHIANTVISIQPNINKFVPVQLQSNNSKQQLIEYIDIPGHPTYQSIQTQYLQPNLRATIYIIDNKCNAGEQQKQYIANNLFNILCNQQLIKSHMPLLLVVNEHSDSTINSSELIDDIELIIDTKRYLDNSMSDIGDTLQMDNKNKLFRLGSDTPFKFSDSQLPVSVQYVNIKEKRIDPIIQFLSHI